MTDVLSADPSVGIEWLPRVLSWTAIALLIFVSGGVIYLSTVEWRDRRRRSAASPRKRP